MEESDDEEEKYELCSDCKLMSKNDVLSKLHFAMTTNLMMDKLTQSRLSKKVARKMKRKMDK